MVKPEKFGHLHLVYHFKIPSNTITCQESSLCYVIQQCSTVENHQNLIRHHYLLLTGKC